MYKIESEFLVDQIDEIIGIEKDLKFVITEEVCENIKTYIIDGLKILLDSTTMQLSDKLSVKVKDIQLKDIISIFHIMSENEASEYRLGYKCYINLNDGVIKLEA